MSPRTRPPLGSVSARSAVLALAAFAFAHAAILAAETPDLLEVSLRSPHERKGDYDALAASWLEALSAGAATPLAELPASRLAGILPFVKDPLALIPAIEKAMGPGLASGAAREALAEVLGRLYVSAGRLDDARRLAESRGHLRRWWIIGPFGASGDAPFRRTYGPETDDRLSAKHREGWRDLEWRRIAAEGLEPFVDPFRYVHPRGGAAYLLNQVEAKQDIDALLERGSADTIRIWVDGVLVADEDISTEFIETRRATPLRLRAGWHRILVKTAAPAWVRIADASGKPLPPGILVEDGEAEMREIGARPPGGIPRANPFAFWTSSIEEAEKAAAGANPSPASRKVADLRMGLALVAQSLGRQEIAVEQAEKAMALLPDDPMVLLHAGSVFRYARYLPESISKNRSRAAFAKALEADPDLLVALERLARFLEEDEEHSKAALKVREALAKDPGFFRGLIRLKEIYASQEWKHEEIEVVREIERVAPLSPQAALFWASHYENLNNPDRALEHYRKAWALDKASSDPLERAAEIELGKGRIAEAEEAIREAARMEPDPNAGARRLMNFLDRVGREEEALELARRLAEENPMDPARLRRIGELEESLGRGREALETYRKALAIGPGELELKRYIESRAGRARAEGEGAGGPEVSLDEFWKPYDETLEEWLLAIPGEGPLVGRASSLMVLDICVVRVEPDGSYSEYVHNAYKVLTEESKDELANVSTPGSIITLRTVGPGGEVLEPVAAEGRESWVMPGIVPGALLDIAYRTDHARSGGRPFRNGPFYFQDGRFKQAVMLTRYVLLLPPGIDAGILEANVARERGATGAEADLARVEKTVREIGGGMRAITWESRNVPRLEPEQFLPDRDEYIPNVTVLEKKSWEDVFASIEYPHTWVTRATPEVREAAARAAGDKEDVLERARAIYDWVNELVAKPGRPPDAVRILLEKTGDRTVLFKALCDAAGVPTRWAFLRPAEAWLPRTDWEFPRADLFPYRHVLLEIEGKAPIYVSLAQRFTPFGRLPEYLDGGKALVVREGQGRIEMLPGTRPEDSAISSSGELRLGKELEVDANVRLEMRALSAFGAKEQFRNMPAFQRDVALRQFANSIFPGARIATAQVTGLEEKESPFGMSIELTAPKFVRESGERFLVKAVLQPGNLVRSFGGRSVRQHPFHFRGQRVMRDSMRIVPGEGYRIERPPSAVSLVSALGMYSLTSKIEDGAITVRRELTLLPGRIDPADFPAFLSFCEKVDAAETESVVLVKS